MFAIQYIFRAFQVWPQMTSDTDLQGLLEAKLFLFFNVIVRTQRFMNVFKLSLDLN